MTLSTLTLKDAVNQMLDCTGDTQVNTLEAPLRLEVATAKRMLENECRRFQTAGYNFNSDYDFELQPNSDGEITVPINALSIDLTDYDASLDIVQRSGKLYNRYAKTFQFTQTLKCDITWLLDFEDMPQSARDLVTIIASRKFQADTVGSELLYKFSDVDLNDAWALFNRQDLKSEDCNMLYGNRTSSNIVRRNPDNGSGLQ